jgi:hypothetical protein
MEVPIRAMVWASGEAAMMTIVRAAAQIGGDQAMAIIDTGPIETYVAYRI